MKSGSLNLVEPSGPVQACSGIACTCNVSDGTREIPSDSDTLFAVNKAPEGHEPSSFP